MALPSRARTFGLESCQDLLRKLNWEYDQLLQASVDDADALMFGAYNAAVTAWHLTDWVWHDMTLEQRQQVADEWGVPLASKSDFQVAVRKKDLWVGLCREIATASKHAVVKRSTIADMNAIVSAARFPPTTSENGLDIQQAGALRWVIKVEHEGKAHLLVDVVSHALDFWTNLIHGHGIG